ncbi:unnamed protein product, partial [Angiostrongylus costaricensis]|uniref:63 kDa sperm flagellar membrane protein n=1 Tax=Angiostrongylus costaricensis TaxID=334426 RepID=A0A0R3PHZ1_ANGCS
MPISLTDEQMAPARLLTLTPSGNTTQSISSTVTTMPGESTPLVGSVTAMGVPLLQGMLICPEARHTTTIITTTTTTYRMVEVSDSDSLSDDFEVLDENALTVDVSLLTPGTSSPQSPQYMIIEKRESEGPLSLITRSRMDIDLKFPPIGIERSTELDEKPIMEMVSVYHSGFSDLPYKQSEENKFEGSLSEKFAHGRSDEPAPRSDEEHIDLADVAKTFGDKITGLFRRRPTIPDYPSSEPYAGPLVDTRRREDIDSQPLHTAVTVYHSGRSDIPHEKVVFAPEAVEVHQEMHYDYPTTTAYEGPLESTNRIDDIQGEPLTHHVTVYHSGRSDEPAPKSDEAHIDLSNAAKTFGDKITGLFKKGAAHLDYPVSALYEGPLDSTQRIDDIQGEPLTHHVTVYHSGRSDEPAPKPDEAHIDLADAAKAFGDKITGLFRRRPTIPDYPSSEPYAGPLVDTRRREDIDSQPLHTAVTVYHSGRSDIPHEKVVFAPEAVEVHQEMHYDYP